MRIILGLALAVGVAFGAAAQSSYSPPLQIVAPPGAGGSGTVTSLANPSVFGVTCSVASATTIPAITCTAGTPVLGTPTSITLTNATGLPISTGVSGLGSGEAAALANAVNTSTGMLTGAAPDGTTIVLAANKLSVAAPTRTATAPTVATTDMGGTIWATGTITIPAISAGLFDAKQTLLLVNVSGSTETVTSTPTVNAGGGCIQASGIPAGYGWQIQSNNTTLDCIQIVSPTLGTAATVNTGTSGPTIPLLNGTNTFSGTQTFGAVVGGVNAQTGTTYTLAATDCGQTVKVTNASAITVTTFQAAVVGCSITVVQGGAGQITFANGGSATLVSSHSYTKTFNAAGATVNLNVLANAGAAAVFTLSGDGA